ncbi:hypothetical protein Scep_015518 [Stephania cephalantha]|uniref:Fatty acyl-CoA reductase n=1 Tax=Stephania cephalantha TaxID=152367 RepID=A0AAP0J300_9MAGN
MVVPNMKDNGAEGGEDGGEAGRGDGGEKGGDGIEEKRRRRTYVCGEKCGLVEEKPFRVGETLNGSPDLDIKQEIDLANETLEQLRSRKATNEDEKVAMKELGLTRARMYGWPNTYVFTKALGEMLIGDNKENIPIAIIRPTIITSTYKEPFPGWVDGIR